MTPKQLKAATERDIARIVAAVEKHGESIGVRFGDIDKSMMMRADEFVDSVRDWAKEQRAYIDECVKAGLWDGI